VNFLETIWERLQRDTAAIPLAEIRDGRLQPVPAAELLTLVATGRGFLRRAGLKPGDRCALLAANSARWVALDLALMAEGLVVVPLYSRQAPRELAAMIKDSSPALVCCGDAALRDAIARAEVSGPRLVLFEEVFAAPAGGPAEVPEPRTDADPLTIIYTSGTSGEPKGVVLTVGNLSYMLSQTNARLDHLMAGGRPPESVCHYLPFNFCGSWISLLTGLSRNARVVLCTDLARIADDLKLAEWDYFLNVPVLLERIRKAIEEQLARRGGLVQSLFDRGMSGGASASALDAASLWLARRVVFPRIRRAAGLPHRALLCGSAPLAQETQEFFTRLGVPVLQIYGLTETTAICTMDDPRAVEPGTVGPAIPGIAMKLGEQNEILVRGPNLFPGYWNRPEETAKVLREGWFHTGDQGEQTARGNWRILGRVKNLLILSSGHNVAPEPLEEALARALPAAQPVMLVGHGRSHLAALVTGAVSRPQVEAALEGLNAAQPHYQRIRAFHICAEAFTIENGLLTANGKLKRDAIAARYCAEIEAMYRTKGANS
jgi:long-chain acyl-CoA synthetase